MVVNEYVVYEIELVWLYCVHSLLYLTSCVLCDKIVLHNVLFAKCSSIDHSELSSDDLYLHHLLHHVSDAPALQS